MTRRMMMVVGLAIAAAPAAAQDISSPYDSAIADHGQMQLESTLARRRLQQAQARRRAAPPALSAAEQARVRNACLNRRQVAARMSAADGRQLYALCAKAGY